MFMRCWTFMPPLLSATRLTLLTCASYFGLSVGVKDWPFYAPPRPVTLFVCTNINDLRLLVLNCVDDGILSRSINLVSKLSWLRFFKLVNIGKILRTSLWLSYFFVCALKRYSLLVPDRCEDCPSLFESREHDPLCSLLIWDRLLSRPFPG